MMRNEQKEIKKTILFMGITLAVYFGMKYVLPVVIPFLFGGLLAVCFNPLVEKMTARTGRGRGLISMLAVAAVLAAAAALCFFAGRAVFGQLAALAQNSDSIEGGMREIWCGCCDRIEKSLGVRIRDPEGIFEKMQYKVRSGFQSGTLPYLLKNSVTYAKTLFAVIGISLISIISGLLMLSDYPKIQKAVHSSDIGKLAVRIKQHAKEAGGTYLKAQIIILLIISLICAAGLFLTGNAYALIAGMGIGLCDAMPFIGTGIVFVPWMIFNIINGEYVLAAVCGVLYVICSFVRQLLEPRLIGERLGCPPIAVLMSIYIGVHVYGAAGVFSGPVSVFLIYELYTAAVDRFLKDI